MIPALPQGTVPLDELRLYYVRLGFLASAYVNQVGQEPATACRATLPFPSATLLTRRPPILSYDGYALYNWKRFDPAGPIALGNIDTIQNFVHLYDEHWFILVHVEIEALAAAILRRSIGPRAWPRDAKRPTPRSAPSLARSGPRSTCCAGSPRRWTPRSITRLSGPTSASSRSGLRGGRHHAPGLSRRDGGQSSVIPTIVAFLKIPHRPSMLTDHLADIAGSCLPSTAH